MKKLQYVSDIHLERRRSIPNILIKHPYIALLGDIGNPFLDNYAVFLRYVSNNADKVFLLAGNHEYWHHNQSTEKVRDRISSICNAFNNVEFLSNSVSSLENYKILGTTLWVPWYKKTYIRNVKWLVENIEENPMDTIVLTHYLPSYKLIAPCYQTKKYEPIQYRYASELDHIIKSPLKAWLCGHSHVTYETYINGVYCGINAYTKNYQIRSIDLTN